MVAVQGMLVSRPMSAETRAQEGELFGGLSSVLQSCAHTSVPSVSCLRSVWPLLGCQPQTSSVSSYFLLSEQGTHSFVFPQSSDQLSIIAVGLFLLMSGNISLSLSLCFYPFHICILHRCI